MATPLNSVLYQTFDEFTHDEEGEYNNYCGALDYEIVGGDTSFVQLAGRIITAHSSSAGDVGNHYVTIRGFLVNHPGVYRDVGFWVNIEGACEVTSFEAGTEIVQE